MLQLARSWRAAFLATAALFINAANSLACQCPDRPSLAEAARRADIVVVATPVATRLLSSLSVGSVQLERVAETTLRVSRSWKGGEPFLQVLGGFGDCEYRQFTIGTPYIVFADRNIASLGKKEGFVWVGRCLPTRLFSALSNEDLNSLGPSAIISAPRATLPGARTTGYSSRTMTAILAVSTIIVMGAAVAFILRRRRRGEHYGS